MRKDRPISASKLEAFWAQEFMIERACDWLNSVDMRMYTTPEQTAKLIELGFEKPKNERWVLDVANESTPSIQNIVKKQDYSIGELIEMLPQEFRNASGSYLSLSIHTGGLGTWDIQYLGFEAQIRTCEFELIDALYGMIIMLKEEGVI